MPANSFVPVSLPQNTSLLPATLSSIGSGSHGKPVNVKEAATQFEGMLIGEMLHSVHDSNSGSLDGDEESDSESDTIYSMAADQFAQLMAKQGGFGVAKLLTQGLTDAQSSTASPKSGDANHGNLKMGEGAAGSKRL